MNENRPDSAGAASVVSARTVEDHEVVIAADPSGEAVVVVRHAGEGEVKSGAADDAKEDVATTSPRVDEGWDGVRSCGWCLHMNRRAQP